MLLPARLLSRSETRLVLATLRRLDLFYEVWHRALILGLLEDGMTIDEIRAQTDGRLPAAFAAVDA